MFFDQLVAQSSNPDETRKVLRAILAEIRGLTVEQRREIFAAEAVAVEAEWEEEGPEAPDPDKSVLQIQMPHLHLLSQGLQRELPLLTLRQNQSRALFLLLVLGANAADLLLKRRPFGLVCAIGRAPLLIRMFIVCT